MTGLGLGLGTEKPLLAGGIEQGLDVLTCLVLAAVQRQAIGDLIKELFTAVSSRKQGAMTSVYRSSGAAPMGRWNAESATARCGSSPGYTRGWEAGQSLRRKRPPR